MCRVFLSMTLLAWRCLAQPTQAPLPSFEVSSVKLLKPDAIQNQPRGLRITSGSVIGKATLNQLICDAFQIQAFQIVGGPRWADEDLFDVWAKADPLASPAQERLMLQRLLAERFALLIHNETRKISFYALIRGRNTKIDALDPDDATPQGIQLRTREFHVRSMDRLAQWISHFSDRPVIDKTEMDGPLDIRLDLTGLRLSEILTERPLTVEGLKWAYSTFFLNAVQTQLGLVVERRSEPFGFVVVDHVTKAIGND